MAEELARRRKKQPFTIGEIEETTRKWILPLAITVGVCFATSGALNMLNQLYLKELGAEPLIISLNMTLFWLAMLIGSVFWGTLSDHYQVKPLLFVIIGATTLTAGILALLLPAPGVLTTIFVRAFVISGLIPISMAIVSRASSSHRRGRNLSYITFPRTMGRALGTALAGFLVVALGFKVSFLALAALPLVGLPLLFRLPEDAKAVSTGRESSLRRLKESGLGSLYVGATLAQMGAMGSLSLVFVYMASLGIPAGIMGMISALGPAVAMPGVLLFGRLADRVRRKAVFALGFGMVMLMPLIFAFARGAWGMAAGHLAFGISFSALYIGSTAHIGDLIPAQRHGQMLGLFDSIRAFGGVLGPLVAGATTSSFGFQGMFLTMAGIATLGFVLVLFRPHAPATTTLK